MEGLRRTAAVAAADPSAPVDAVLKVRIGKHGKSEFEARRIVLPRAEGGKAALQCFQKESKKRPGAPPLQVRRSIPVRDIREIKLSDTATNAGGGVQLGQLHIEIVTADNASARRNIGLEFADVKSFQTWHAALYSRWLQCSKASTGASARHAAAVSSKAAAAAIAAACPPVDLSDALFGIMAYYNRLVTAPVLPSSRHGGRDAARAEASVAAASALLQMQTMHENFVMCAAAAAERIIEELLYAGMLANSGGGGGRGSGAVVSKGDVKVDQGRWPLRVQVTAWDPVFEGVQRAGQEKWKLDGHVRGPRLRLRLLLLLLLRVLRAIFLLVLVLPSSFDRGGELVLWWGAPLVRTLARSFFVLALTSEHWPPPPPPPPPLLLLKTWNDDDFQALRNARYVQYSTMTSQLTARNNNANAFAGGGGGGGGGVGVQVFTRPACVVDHLGFRATVTLLHRDERSDDNAKLPPRKSKVLPAQATAQVGGLVGWWVRSFVGSFVDFFLLIR